MWPWFRSTDRTKAFETARPTSVRRAGAFLTACIALMACAPAEYEIDQPVVMGPWTFRVERTTTTQIRRGPGNSVKTVFVFLSLDNYRQRHERTFDGVAELRAGAW